MACHFTCPGCGSQYTFASLPPDGGDVYCPRCFVVCDRTEPTLTQRLLAPADVPSPLRGIASMMSHNRSRW